MNGTLKSHNLAIYLSIKISKLCYFFQLRAKYNSLYNFVCAFTSTSNSVAFENCSFHLNGKAKLFQHFPCSLIEIRVTMLTFVYNIHLEDYFEN